MLATAIVAAVLQVCCAPPDAFPAPQPVAGPADMHDPAAPMIRPDRPGFTVHGSTGMALDTADGRVLTPAPRPLPEQPWWQPFLGPETQAGTAPWAPDVSFHGDRWWMYYAVSTFGTQHSAIGLATSPSGEPGTWADQGMVLSSKAGDPYNAIDPNLLVDAGGRWWLVFGSAWKGIFAQPLDPATGKPTADAPTQLAERPGEGTIEAPFVYQHNGAYYLFVSFDRCCDGTDSTYSVRVGRADQPTGPYVDADGRPMLQGGGTVVLASHGDVKGPGGQSVYRDGERDLIVYHYYDGSAEGRATLGLNALGWDARGFPRAF